MCSVASPPLGAKPSRPQARAFEGVLVSTARARRYSLPISRTAAGGARRGEFVHVSYIPVQSTIPVRGNSKCLRYMYEYEYQSIATGIYI